MEKMPKPILVDFPLKGEWFTPNTPGKRVPSHGTDQLGQRYAYDFMMMNWSDKKIKPYRGENWRYYLVGMPLSQWYGWGQNVYAPCDGKVLAAKDGVRERQRLHIFTDMFVVLKNALFFNPEKHDLHRFIGNYIIMEAKDAYAFLAHFQKGSICVREGQEVRAGELLGRVGHSGNSTAPHLHFHLMDSPDLLTAKGLPCAFKQYERFHNGKWEEVIGGIPTEQDRIRVCPA